MNSVRISDCKIYALPRIEDGRGNLTFIESDHHVPFEIKRVFYFYGMPPGESRGAHAHRHLHQFMICLAGGFDVRIDDGESSAIVHLDRPWEALHVPPMIWAAEINLAPGTICVVLCSDPYDEEDYIRDRDEYLRIVHAGSR